MLKVAIIGTGGIAPSHIEGYLEFNDRCKIVALVDIYPEKAHKMNERFELNADVYDSHKELFKRDDIDLVSVCTPPYTHAEIAIDMLENSTNVLLEKPMAPSIEECDKIIAAVRETGMRLSVISQNRFKSQHMNLKKMLDSGVAGKVVHAQVDSVWWRARSYYDLWWRGTWEKEGGGCTLNHAVHHVDMLCWMNGFPKEITSYLANLAHDNSEVEDYSTTISRYEDGSMSMLNASLVHHGEDQKFVFQCEKAKLQSPWDVYASKAKSNGFFEKDEEQTKSLDEMYKNLEEIKYEGHTGQIDNVLTALISGDDFLINASDGKNTIEFITAVYKSWFENTTVQLPISKNDKWYTAQGVQDNVEKFYEKTGSVENFDDESISV